MKEVSVTLLCVKILRPYPVSVKPSPLEECLFVLPVHSFVSIAKAWHTKDEPQKQFFFLALQPGRRVLLSL